MKIDWISFILGAIVFTVLTALVYRKNKNGGDTAIAYALSKLGTGLTAARAWAKRLGKRA